MIRAVIFDIGDTLWKLGPLPGDIEGRMIARMAGEFGVGAETASELVRRGLASARARSNDGTHREANLVIELSAAAQALGVPLGRQELEGTADALGEADIARFVPNPSLATLFAGLRRTGLRIGVLSNTWTRGILLERYLGDVGAAEHISAGIYSGDEGIRKPHQDIYRRALDGLAVAPAEALFVGDRVAEDVLGPRSIGMRAVLSHEHRQEDPGDAAPLAVIDRLEDVVAIVEAFNTASGG